MRYTVKHNHKKLYEGHRRKAVCTIVGTKSSGSKWSHDVESMAFHCGAFAARNGFIVATGGKSGVMEAAAAGAKAEGGSTMGILPNSDRRCANEWIDIVIPTGIGLARNMLTALVCDCMIAVPGGHGTLQEMSYAIEYNRPVLSWDSWKLDEVEFIGNRADNHKVAAWLHRRKEEWIRQLVEFRDSSTDELRFVQRRELNEKE